MINIQIIPVFDDNYTYLITTPCGVNGIIDPGEAGPVIDKLNAQNKNLDFIFNTHHHWDHISGNDELKSKYNAQIIAPEKEAKLIGNIDITVKDDDVIKLGDHNIVTIETPGHTRGGVCYYFPDASAVFTGDSLFSMGCGRLFEGTPMDMFKSLQKIIALPDDTMVYCGHEYTRGNAGFCLAQDPENSALKQRISEVKSLRKQNKPTLPVSLSIEKQTNVFLKAKSAEEFAALRKKKDNF